MLSISTVPGDASTGPRSASQAVEASEVLRERAQMRPTETLHDHMARALIWRASAG